MRLKSILFVFFLWSSITEATEYYFRLNSGAVVVIYLPEGWALAEAINEGVEFSYQVFTFSSESYEYYLGLRESVDSVVFEELHDEHFNNDQGAFFSTGSGVALFGEPVHVAIGAGDNVWAAKLRPQAYSASAHPTVLKYPCYFCTRYSSVTADQRHYHICKDHNGEYEEYHALDGQEINCPHPNCSSRFTSASGLFRHWGTVHRGALLPKSPPE